MVIPRPPPRDDGDLPVITSIAKHPRPAAVPLSSTTPSPLRPHSSLLASTPHSTSNLWAILPSTVRLQILTQLPLPALFSFRCSAICQQGHSSYVEICLLFRSVVTQLDAVRRAAGLHITSIPTPVSFATDETTLAVNVHRSNYSVLDIAALHLPRLSDLSIEALPPPHPRLVDLPIGLSRACALTTLRVTRQDLVVVPEVVLRLRLLRTLDLTGNEKLQEIPKDIGVRLPCLESIKLYETGVRELPESLLETVNRNHERKPSDFVDPHAIGVTKSMFEEGYLQRVICRTKYPRLTYNMRFILE